MEENKTENKVLGALHGECLVHQADIPEGAKKLDIKKFLKIAESETTGNHHVVDAEEGIEFFEKDKVLYMKNTVPANMRCVHTDRHDDVKIPEGTWQFDKQKEFDYISMSLQNVRD